MRLSRTLIFFLILIGCSRLPEKHSTEKLENKAYDASESGNYANSINYYNQLIKEDSLNGRYYFGRGYSYSMLVKKNEAIKDYLKSAQLNYKKGSCYYNIGLLNTFLNDSLAQIYFKEALKIYPNRLDIQKEYDNCSIRLKPHKSISSH